MGTLSTSIGTGVHWFLKGFKQSLIGASQVLTVDTTGSRKRQDRQDSNENRSTCKGFNPIVTKILQCGLLNGGVFGLSVFLFYNGFIPILKYVTQMVFGMLQLNPTYHTNAWYWMEVLLSYTFNALWVIPSFWLSKPLNSFWFQEIATSSYQSSKGRPKPTLTTKSSSLAEASSRIIADFFFSILVEFLFLMQGSIIDLIPIIGRIICILHMSILYSLYAFEYKWINMGFVVQERLYRIEYNLPYYCGFGLPLAILTYLPESFFIGTCVFSVFFPFLIFSATVSPSFKVNKFNVVTYRIFTPVIWLTNVLLMRTKGRQEQGMDINASHEY